MIYGINSSSISRALRTASNANNIVTKTTQQIATGKKVASVKDDGAAYVRASALRSQQTQIETRGNIIAILRTASEQAMTGDQIALELSNEIKNVIISAKSYPVGSNARIALQKDFESLISQLNMPFNTDSTSSGSYGSWGAAGWGIEPNAADPILSQNATWFYPSGNVGAFWTGQTINGTSFATNNLTNASNLYLDNMLNHSELMVSSVFRGSYIPWAASDQKWFDDVEAADSKMLDNLDQSIANLTNADLGKVSAQKDLAQTRQQLAYQTVKNAISQYGDVAGGLLNNIMGTQRNIKA